MLEEFWELFSGTRKTVLKRFRIADCLIQLNTSNKIQNSLTFINLYFYQKLYL